MIRTIWLLASAVAAFFLAPFVYLAIPDVMTALAGTATPAAALNLLKADATVIAVGLVSSGLVVFTLLAFLLPGVIEGVQAGMARHRLQSAAGHTSARAPFSEHHFREAFVYAPFLGDMAGRYSGFLTPVQVETKGWKGAAIERHEALHATVPAAEFFNPAAMVHGRLFLWLFRPLPLTLLGVGVISFLAILARVANLAAADPWPGVIMPASIALALAATGAAIIYFLVRATLDLRIAQADKLAVTLDGLFHYTPAVKQLREVLAANQAQMKSVESAMKSLHVAIERSSEQEAARLSASIEAAGEMIAHSLRNDLTAVLKEPLDRITLSAKQITEDQSAQIQHVLANTLKAFLGELEGHVGLEIRALQQVLDKAAESATRLEAGVGQSGKLLTKLGQSQSAELSAAFASQAKALEDAIKGLEQSAGRSFREASEGITRAAVELQALAARIQEMVETQKTPDVTRLAGELRNASRALGDAGGPALKRAAFAAPPTPAFTAPQPANLDSTGHPDSPGNPDSPAVAAVSGEEAATARAGAPAPEKPSDLGKELRRIRELSARRDLPKL